MVDGAETLCTVSLVVVLGHRIMSCDSDERTGLSRRFSILLCETNQPRISILNTRTKNPLTYQETTLTNKTLPNAYVVILYAHHVEAWMIIHAQIRKSRESRWSTGILGILVMAEVVELLVLALRKMFEGLFYSSLDEACCWDDRLVHQTKWHVHVVCILCCSGAIAIWFQ
jgi:hypothetical protein